MARKDFDPDTILSDGRLAAIAQLFDATADEPRRGFVDGASIDGPVTILAYGTDIVGEGPRLHVHPYDETFVVIEGSARFFVGHQVIDACAGDVVLGPAAVPHRFKNLGPGRLQTIDIHHSPRWIQSDLE